MNKETCGCESLNIKDMVMSHATYNDKPTCYVSVLQLFIMHMDNYCLFFSCQISASSISLPLLLAMHACLASDQYKLHVYIAHAVQLYIIMANYHAGMFQHFPYLPPAKLFLVASTFHIYTTGIHRKWSTIPPHQYDIVADGYISECAIHDTVTVADG